MKKFALIMLCVLLVAVATGCNVKRNDKIQTDDENGDAVVNESVDEENNTDIVEDEGKNDEEAEDMQEDKTQVQIPELNIKPLEETDEKELESTSKQIGFENGEFLRAFANAIGKKPSDVTQEDIDNVRYIALGPDDEESHSLFIGHSDYIDACFSAESADSDLLSRLNELVMMSEYIYDENDSLEDLGKFKNLEMFEIYDVKIEDVSFVKQYEKLAFGYFRNNGITDVSPLADYNPETLWDLDFSGNTILDWSPLRHIAEKVIVIYDKNSGFEIRLDTYLDNNKPSTEKSDTAEKQETVIVDSEGNPADFGALFD